MFSKPMLTLSLAAIAAGCIPEPELMYGTVVQDNFSIETCRSGYYSSFLLGAGEEYDCPSYWFEVETAEGLYTISVINYIRDRPAFAPQTFYDQIDDRYNNLRETIQAGTKVRFKTYEPEKTTQSLYIDDIIVLK